jgi:predicted nuclease of predicted toxin-antitoxin system
LNIFVDANIPQKITSRLKEEGYSVEYVDRYAEDTAIIEAAYRNKAF